MLKIEHLKKTFSGKTILDDISLEVKSGEIVSIIGPSGTGKTTLLRCVNFLEKPDRGTITIDEVNRRCGAFGWKNNPQAGTEKRNGFSVLQPFSQ